MIVIVDRVDEPDLINGLAERMKLLVWPLLDNKLLKHENWESSCSFQAICSTTSTEKPESFMNERG